MSRRAKRIDHQRLKYYESRKGYRSVILLQFSSSFDPKIGEKEKKNREKERKNRGKGSNFEHDRGIGFPTNATPLPSFYRLGRNPKIPLKRVRVRRIQCRPQGPLSVRMFIRYMGRMGPFSLIENFPI